MVLEGKLSFMKMRINVDDGINFVSSGIESLGKKKATQMGVNAAENDQSENSDSGYFRNGPKKVESDVSVHGFARNIEFKKQKVDFVSSYDDDLDAESGKRLRRSRHMKTQSGKDFIEEDVYKQADGALMDSKKKCKIESTKYLSSSVRNRGSKCVSLGERRTSHNRTKGCSDSVYESEENSVDTDYVPNPVANSSRMIHSRREKTPIEKNSSGKAEKKLGLKIGKVHECPFCPKVFRSGQALGGHKRSHFIGAARGRTVVIEQDGPAISMRGQIDLNLPVSMEEESDGLGPW